MAYHLHNGCERLLDGRCVSIDNGAIVLISPDNSRLEFKIEGATTALIAAAARYARRHAREIHLARLIRRIVADREFILSETQATLDDPRWSYCSGNRRAFNPATLDLESSD